MAAASPDLFRGYSEQHARTPKSSKTIYQYRYDDKKRLIEKRVPSKGWEYMVYNKIDQVVFTQDANQRTGTQWTFTKYDAMGREILTGLYTDGSTRLVLQASVTASVAPLYESRTNATATGYSNVALPTTSITNYWVQSYYDDYDFLGMGTTYPPNGVISYRVKGLLTGKKVFQTNLAASYWTMYYYDDEGREKETYAQNQLNGYDRTINTYNFASELTNSIRTHVANADTTTIANTYHYDHRGRSIATTSNINNQGEVVLNRNYYNEIGQLNQKNLHSADAGSSYLQASLLRYNERGWLSSSSSNPFSFQLNYNDGTTPQYNGNVANQLWGAAAVLPNTFTYGYDKLNRLTSGASTGIAMSEAMAYDLSGNIIALTRDALSGSYNYSGNRLTNITGTLGTGSYVYDANGNATTDGRNGVALAYNFLNLPTSATKTGLNLAYTYNAEGVKLRRTNSTTSTTTDYVDGIQYSNNVLQFIQTTEGRAANVGGTYIYEYDLKDHLGNVRLTLRKVPETGVLAVLQKDDYYPFGKQKIAINGNNKYLYNSKELQEGLEQYDYGARFYDPVVGRWNVVDPLAQERDWLSPYNYAQNNPIVRTDPDGMLDNEVLLASKNFVDWSRGEGKYASGEDEDRFGDDQDDPKKKGQNVLGNLSGEKVLPKVEGFWENVWYSLNPREFEKDGLTYSVNNEGKTTGLRPIGGTIEIGPGGLRILRKLGPRTITGFTKHAASEAAITRGFKTVDIMKIVKEGEVLIIRAGKQIKYTLGGNSVVIEQTGRNAGKVVTVYSSAAGSAKGFGKGNFIPKK
ncbi:MAG: RHS repeat-associated core domain-containing protein [Bacteroidota bacterium]